MDFSDFDDHDGDIVSEGPTSTVFRVESDLPDGPRILAVKTSTTVHAKEPHDIVKEVRLLASLAHPNIVPLIKHELSQESQSLSFWMPYLPYSLDELLQSSRFSPHPIISFGSIPSPSPTPREAQFIVLAKSIIFQILSGVSYLHSEPIQIAHRDIKPSNVLLTPSGRAQLIDFGIAFPASEDSAAKARDLWPESAARMYFEVSTGPYRAPELLFGSRTYDAFAIDAWSLGVTLSEFFTPLRLHADQDEDEFYLAGSDDAGSDSSAEPPRPPTPPPTPFVIPQGAHTRPGMPKGRWTRATLFDGTRGEIGLAWSIFKVRGTPNEHTWPSFLTLPDAGKLAFVHTDAIDLSTRLPNLPPSSPPPSSSSTGSDRHLDTRTHAPVPVDVHLSDDAPPHPVDLVRRFLVYEPVRRLRPAEALRHPWLAAAVAGEPGLVLPADAESEPPPLSSSCSTETGGTAVTATHTFTSEGRSRTLGDLLRLYVADKGDVY